MLRITLPIVKPALLSTFLLVFASSMSAYSVPVFLGSPVRYYVLSTKMMSLINNYPGQGYIIAAVMIIFGVTILAINQHITGSRKSYTTVTGKSSQISLIDLRRANTVISVLLIAVLLLVAVLPLITFALESVIIKAGDYSFSNMTLDFWIGRDLTYLDQGDSTGILLSAKVLKALGYSLLLAITCSLVAGTSGILVGYGIEEKHIRFETKAVWWAQILKVVFGLLALLVCKEGLKLVFSAVGFTWLGSNAIRYFAVVLMASVVWPLTFPWFAQLGAGKEPRG